MLLSRKNIFYPPVIVTLLFATSCHKRPSRIDNLEASAPKRVVMVNKPIAKVMTKPPLIVPIKDSIITKAGQPIVIQLPDSVVQAGPPRIVHLGKPIRTKPGEGGSQNPFIEPATTRSIPSGVPEVVLAGDPQIKEKNTNSFHTYQILQGLKSNEVFSLMQDKSGNIWIGTWEAGVSKFDGRNFTHITTREGLISNNIWSMLADSKGNIWFGSAQGLCKYDGKTFTEFPASEGLAKSFIVSLMEDRKGNIWIGTQSRGLCKYDGKSLTWYDYRQGLPKSEVSAVLEDKDDNLWIGTRAGLVKFDGEIFSTYTRAQGLTSDAITKIHQDKLGNIWFFTYGGGFSKINDDTLYEVSTAQGLNNANISDFAVDHNGVFWLATNSGLNRYDGKTITHLGLEHGLPNRLLIGALEDRNGNIWFGSAGGGVFRYDGSLFTHLHHVNGLPEGGLTGVMQDRKRQIWVATFGGGISIYDGKKIQQYQTQQGLAVNEAECFLEDRTGNIWIATWGGGMQKFDGRQFIQFSTGPLSIRTITCLFEDNQRNIWIGTESNLYKKDSTHFTQFDTSQGKPQGTITCIREDHKGHIWISSTEGGVCEWDGKQFLSYTTQQGLSTNNITSIFPDKAGNIWFGTIDEGAIKFDGKSFLQFRTQQGLINNSVSGILEDTSGNMWFLTSNGVSRMQMKEDSINTSLSIFKNYTTSEGFLGVSVYSPNSAQLGPDGNLWIGTTDRLTSYHPEGESPDTIRLTVQLTSLSLFNENIPWMDLDRNKDSSFKLNNGVRVHNFRFKELSNWYFVPQQLSLPYDNNYLRFQFVGITPSRANFVKYQYALEGFEDRWNATDKPEAIYNNLPPGDYSFLVKAVNSEGYWSKEFRYPFEIRPPWWQTKVAYALYAVTILLILWTFIRYRSRKLKAENILLEARVSDRTTQLKKSLEDLRETQTQLIQREKMASLGELTAGIAHEIQNPLNFVNNFSEVSHELLGEMKDELATGNGVEAMNIADDVKQNLEKVIYHGKRAEAIVKGMLQHSRSSSGQKEPTDINALADEYLRLSFHGLRAKDKSFNAKTETSFDSSITPINIIAEEIGRVLLNLFNNAFYSVTEKKKLHPDNYEPLVSVSTRKLISPAQETVEIRVRDNGMGVPQKILDKIFQPFFTTKPTGQGTGLGLSLSYDIITKVHGGELKVETKEGDFAEFVILLSYK